MRKPLPLMLVLLFLIGIPMPGQEKDKQLIHCRARCSRSNGSGMSAAFIRKA